MQKGTSRTVQRIAEPALWSKCQVKGADSSALDAMVIGLRKMKENPSSSRRLAKGSREERPNIKA
jgi:hypothetical protein